MDVKIETKAFKNVERLKKLRVEHRDLDLVINRLVDDPHVDQITLKRLKKRNAQGHDHAARKRPYSRLERLNTGPLAAG